MSPAIKSEVVSGDETNNLAPGVGLSTDQLQAESEGSHSVPDDTSLHEELLPSPLTDLEQPEPPLSKPTLAALLAEEQWLEEVIRQRLQVVAWVYIITLAMLCLLLARLAVDSLTVIICLFLLEYMNDGASHTT